MRGNSWFRDLHYGGTHWTKFDNFPAKGSKDIEGTSLWQHIDWQVQNMYPFFTKRGKKKIRNLYFDEQTMCFNVYVCLFVCLEGGGGSSTSRIFHLYRDVTMIEEGLQILTYLFCTHGHWAVRVFSVQHLLWHRASVHNSHLWVPVTFKPIVENLAVELSLPVFTTLVWDSNTQPSACGIRLLK